jgi:hypothetical protein
MVNVALHALDVLDEDGCLPTPDTWVSKLQVGSEWADELGELPFVTRVQVEECRAGQEPSGSLACGVDVGHA